MPPHRVPAPSLPGRTAGFAEEPPGTPRPPRRAAPAPGGASEEEHSQHMYLSRENCDMVSPSTALASKWSERAVSESNNVDCGLPEEPFQHMHPGRENSDVLNPSTPPARKWSERVVSDGDGMDCGRPEVRITAGSITADSLKDAETRLLAEMQESFERILLAQECAVRRCFEQLGERCVEKQHVGESPASQGLSNGGLAPVLPKRSSSPASDRPGQEQELPPSVDIDNLNQRIRQSLTLRNYRASLTSATPVEEKNVLARTFRRFSKFIQSLKEPERTGRLAALERSTFFEVLTLIMITLTVGIVVFETDRNGVFASKDPPEKGRRSGIRWGFYLEVLCSTFFTSELFLRLYVHKLYFFDSSGWFWDSLDFVTVIVSVVDLAIVSSGGGQATGSNKYLRFLRGLLRMTRMLRIFRSLTYVRPLRLILDCMLSSLPGIFWCCVLVVLATVIAATFLCQCVTTFFLDGLVEPGPPPTPEMQEDLEMLRQSFGTVRKASFSLFEATSGGNWGEYYRILCHTGPFAPSALVVYILLFLVVAWNIITSLFTEKMMSVSQPDVDKQLLERRQKDMKDAMELLGLLKCMDADSSGMISPDEFKAFLGEPSVCTFLESHNIDIADVEMFFKMMQLAVSSEELDLETVVNGIMRMRGVATNLDLQALQFQIQMQNTFQLQAISHTRAQLQNLSTKLLVSGASGTTDACPRVVGCKLSALVDTMQRLEGSLRCSKLSTVEEAAEISGSEGLSEEERKLVQKDIDSILLMPSALSSSAWSANRDTRLL